MSKVSLKDKILALAANNSSGQKISLVQKIENIGTNLKSMPTILSRDLFVEGDINSEGMIEVEGKIKGNIFGNLVIIREFGEVEGQIIANYLNIRGRFSGAVKAKELSISSKAVVSGAVEYLTMSVEDGASIEGQFRKILV